MSIGVGWVGTRADGRRHLFLASDSRVQGGQRLDLCPKILTLPRSDCAICFAGNTGTTYPLMIQLANAIAAHQPARERNLDLTRLKDHILRVFSDIVDHIEDSVEPFNREEAEFILGGYSWHRKDFCLWNIQFSESQKRFIAREAKSFHELMPKAAFIGDWARRMRARMLKDLAGYKDDSAKKRRPVYLAPLRTLASFIREAPLGDTIGGAPQLVRITEHMNTQPLCVLWGKNAGGVTLFGRPLFDYENCDYWIIDPENGKFYSPRKYGHRDHPKSDGRSDAVNGNISNDPG